MIHLFSFYFLLLLGTDGKSPKGRIFGLQLSDPEAPDVPIIAEYVPNPPVQLVETPSSSHTKFSSPLRKSQQRRQELVDAKHKKETIDSAVRDIPDDLVPMFERPEQSNVLLAGDVVMQCPNGFELVDRRCILTVYREPMVMMTINV